MASSRAQHSSCLLAQLQSPGGLKLPVATTTDGDAAGMLVAEATDDSEADATVQITVTNPRCAPLMHRVGISVMYYCTTCGLNSDRLLQITQHLETASCLPITSNAETPSGDSMVHHGDDHNYVDEADIDSSPTDQVQPRSGATVNDVNVETADADFLTEQPRVLEQPSVAASASSDSQLVTRTKVVDPTDGIRGDTDTVTPSDVTAAPRRWNCELCSYTPLYSQVDLAQHVKCHGPSGNGPLACYECPRELGPGSSDWHRVRSHLFFYHKVNFQLQCPHCGATFRGHADYNKHVTSHKYRCSWDYCKFSSLRRADVVAHEKCHVGSDGRQFSCFICKYQHRQLPSKWASMHAHLVSRHSGVIGANHTCAVCGRGFQEFRKYQQHVTAGQKQSSCQKQPHVAVGQKQLPCKKQHLQQHVAEGEQQPHDIVAVGQEQQHVAAGQEQQHVAAGQELLHVVAGQEQQHVAAGQEQQHVAVGQEQQHMAVGQEQPHVAVGHEQQHVAVGQAQPHAAAGREQQHVVVGQKQLYITESQNEPHVAVGQEQPHALGQHQTTGAANNDGSNLLHLLTRKSTRLAAKRKPAHYHDCTNLWTVLDTAPGEETTTNPQMVAPPSDSATTEASQGPNTVMATPFEDDNRVVPVLVPTPVAAASKNEEKVARREAKLPMHRCCDCYKRFATKARLHRHRLRQHSAEKMQRVTCRVCGKDFRNKMQCSNHTRETHEGKRRKRRGRQQTLKLFVCETCGYTTPESSRLRNHVMSFHQGVLPYSCQHCHYSTNEKSDLYRHMWKHRSVKRYQCGECSYATNNRWVLVNHCLKQHNVQLPRLHRNTHVSKQWPNNWNIEQQLGAIGQDVHLQEMSAHEVTDVHDGVQLGEQMSVPPGVYHGQTGVQSEVHEGVYGAEDTGSGVQSGVQADVHSVVQADVHSVVQADEHSVVQAGVHSVVHEDEHSVVQADVQSVVQADSNDVVQVVYIQTEDTQVILPGDTLHSN